MALGIDNVIGNDCTAHRSKGEDRSMPAELTPWAGFAAVPSSTYLAPAVLSALCQIATQ